MKPDKCCGNCRYFDSTGGCGWISVGLPDWAHQKTCRAMKSEDGSLCAAWIPTEAVVDEENKELRKLLHRTLPLLGGYWAPKEHMESLVKEIDAIIRPGWG